MSAAPPSGQRSNIPPDFEELDFEILEEHWNEYDLSDGSRIKARTLLKKVIMDPNNTDNLSFDFVPIISVVYTPPANRGERNHAPAPDEYPNLPMYEIRIERPVEHWNRYRILRNGRVFRVRLSVTQIQRARDRFDNDGLPFYMINSGPMIVSDPPARQPGP